MATRHLRRLRGDQDLLPCALSSSSEPHQANKSADDTDSQDEATSTFNPYAFLAQLQQEEDGDDAGSSEADNPQEAGSKEVDNGESSGNYGMDERKGKEPDVVAAGRSRQVKKRRKKKKKTGKQMTEEEVEDDVDKLVEELQLETIGKSSSHPQPLPEASSSRKSWKSNVLGVSSGSLRADEELYRIFGAQVVASEEAQMQREKERRPSRQPKGVRGLRKQLKTCWLVEVQEHWPPRDSGLSMEFEGTRNDCHWFQYTYSPNYMRSQEIFEDIQMSGDPRAVQMMLQKHPWHVDSLLSMHDYFRLIGEHNQAEEMLNRCLYALEAAWHPFFTVTLGTCKLDVQVPANRSFFKALFRHTQNLCRWGCIATGLECCKLLLSLDEADPMGAIFFIDYLAIRAGKVEFLQYLVDEMDNGSSLALLPGISYSIALSKFKKSKAPKRSSGGRSTKTVESDAGDSDEAAQDVREDACDSLSEAILLYPIVITRLLVKLEAKGVCIDSEFRALLTRPLFAQANDGGSASLSHLVDIFVERHHLLWKAADVLDWLKSGCSAAADAFEATGSDSAAEDWACVRAQAFPPSNVNEYRHLHLYEFSDDGTQLPQDQLQRLMGEEGIEEGLHNGGDLVMNDVVQRLNDLQRIARGRENTAALGPALAFVRSFLPWFQMGEPPPNDGPPNEEQPPR